MLNAKSAEMYGENFVDMAIRICGKKKLSKRDADRQEYLDIRQGIMEWNRIMIATTVKKKS